MAIIFLGTPSIFSMERPLAMGQQRREPSAGQAIKACCIDPFYLSKCAVVGAFLYKSTTRYCQFTQLLATNACAPAAFVDVQNDAVQLIGLELLLLAGINAHYFVKHFKEKTE